MGFNEGDVVLVIDSSWAEIVVEGGVEKNHNMSCNRTLLYNIIKQGCRIPSYKGRDNDVILQNIESGVVVFSCVRFLKLAHRCNTCPKCGCDI